MAPVLLARSRLVCLGMVPTPIDSTFYCKNNCVVKPLKPVSSIRLNSTLPNYSDYYLILRHFSQFPGPKPIFQFYDLFDFLDTMAHQVIFLDLLGPKGHLFQQILYISGHSTILYIFHFSRVFRKRPSRANIYLLWRFDTPASNKQPP